MDKKTFLTELKKSLRILEEEELRDIISEYEQHIDMKMEKGLTEAEAIADFGDLEELKAEILEAYHVRADYEVEQPGKIVIGEADDSSPIDQEEQDGKARELVRDSSGNGRSTGLAAVCVNGIKKGWKWLKSAGAWCWMNVKGLGVWCWGKLCFAAVWCRDRVHLAAVRVRGIGKRAADPCVAANETVPESIECQKEEKAEHTQKKSVQKMNEGVLAWFMGAVVSLWQTAVKAWRWMISAAWWCMKVGWNICWIGTALMLGFFGLMCLFGLGVLVVLWGQGYPLAGFTIGCLGLVLCMLSAAVFCMTLLCRVLTKSPEMKEGSLELEVNQDA